MLCSLARSLSVGLLAWSLVASAWALPAAPRTPPQLEQVPPRIKSLLLEAWAEEQRPAAWRDDELVVAIYCEAARYGSPEGHFRAGRAALEARAAVRDPVAAKFFLTHALELGHQRAADLLPSLREVPMRQPACLTRKDAYQQLARFDFSRYLQGMAASRREIAALVARLAPEYGIDPALAVAVAAVESNFDPRARSPKDAQGVMQLIPSTAAEFGVRDAWNPEDNIRGGLAYLRWLKRRFNGDLEKLVAAYNAGPGAVDRHGGVPPYYETRSYVFRVLNFARRSPAERPPAKPAR